MQYCPKCRISIRGDKTECPLCGGRVTGESVPGGFPVLDRRRFSHMSLVKVGTFCLLTFFIIMMSLEILYDFKLAWVPFAVMGALIAWGDLMVGIYYRNNLIKTLFIETYLAMAVCILIDTLTGWHGWSLAYVLPIGFVMLVFVTIAVRRVYNLYFCDDTALHAADHSGPDARQSGHPAGGGEHGASSHSGLRGSDLPLQGSAQRGSETVQPVIKGGKLWQLAILQRIGWSE